MQGALDLPPTLAHAGDVLWSSICSACSFAWLHILTAPQDLVALCVADLAFHPHFAHALNGMHPNMVARPGPCLVQALL
jgi:hypothetical protein